MGSFWDGAGASIAGSALDFGFGQASSAISWKRQKKVLKNQIRWRVNDMRAAGINPILAVSGGGGLGGGGGAVSAGATGSTDFASSAARLAQAKTEQERAREAKGLADAAELARERVAAEIAMLGASNVRDTAAAANLWQQAKTGKSQQAILDIERVLQQSRIPSAKALQEFDSSTAGQLMQKWNRILEQSGLGSVLGGSLGGVLGGAASSILRGRDSRPDYMEPGSNKKGGAQWRRR